jgi:hypothetical protein
MTTLKRLFGLLRKPGGRIEQCLKEGSVVPIGDSLSNRPDLARIGSSVGDVTEWPSAKQLVQFVLK